MFRGLFLRWSAVVAVIIGFSCPLVLEAATFLVNTTTDTVDVNPGDSVCADDSGQCSLRAAIQEANTLAGDDMITLSANTYSLTISGAGEDNASQGDLDIKDTVTIQGSGTDQTIIDANSLDRILDIVASIDITLTLENMTLQNGSATVDMGGAIKNYTNSTLVISNVSLINNHADQFGGAILTGGSCVITNSLISENDGSAGGGIVSFGSLNLNQSTISKNKSTDSAENDGNGGGLFCYGCTLTSTNSSIFDNTTNGDGGGVYCSDGFDVCSSEFINSTISGNEASNNGGGIFSSGEMFLYNSTITNNTADNLANNGSGGGGIFAAFVGVSTTLRNSIVTGNTDTSGSADDCALGDSISEDYNLIGKGDGCNFAPNTNDQVGTNLNPIVAQLEPLGDNGGPTKTHALGTGSPAIDAGNPAGCLDQDDQSLTADQRGNLRYGPCDIGAFEFGSCGDGYLQSTADEQCDEGTSNSDTTPNTCRTTCQFPACGDSVKDNGEACDDGNQIDEDECSNNCSLPNCGNGTVNAGEECDNGLANSDTDPDACRTVCLNHRCGDDVQDTGEECDDGNPKDGDGCSSACKSFTDTDNDGEDSSIDCNDNNSSVNTKAFEVCDDLDNDCNDQTDEDFDTGTSCSVGVGACQNTGTKVCKNAIETTCNVFANLPETEICDGLDNDCDGETDEGFDVGTACSSGVGVCQVDGQNICTADGQGTECNAVPLDPGTETCNGVDDDCNGSVDEEIAATPTTCGVGACATTGSQTCRAGQLVDSCAPLTAGSELCGDSLDNDCDGTTDEGFDVGTACSAGVGVCQAAGQKVCSADKSTTVCNATPGTAGTETCDGLDNDCDGTTDEDIAATSTTCGVGACAATGSKTCQSGKLVDSCVALAAGTETCGDGIDQDCNGSDLVCSTSSTNSGTNNDDTDSQDQTDDTDETDDATNSEDSTTTDDDSDDSQTVDVPVTENVPPTTTDETTTNTSSSSGGCSLTGTPEQTDATPFGLLLIGLGIMTGIRRRIANVDNKLTLNN